VSQIAIAPARPLGPIDRTVLGGFVEHPGHCIGPMTGPSLRHGPAW
jgi:hypothetical protein